MTRLLVSLGDVPSEVRCAKPNCSVALHTRLQRHHKAHEKMWFFIWAKRRRNEEKFLKFIERYNEFRPSDVVLICDSHHAEIHSIYDRIITEDRQRTKVLLSKYTWTQAEFLMEKLSRACDMWLMKATKGIDSASFTATRSVYKSVLRQQARRK